MLVGITWKWRFIARHPSSMLINSPKVKRRRADTQRGTFQRTGWKSEGKKMMCGGREGKQESHEEYRAQKISFPCVCLNHSRLCLVCIVAYLRLCVCVCVRAKTDWAYSAELLCCLAVFLVPPPFSEDLFFLPHLFQDGDVTLQTGNTKRGRK